MVPSGIQIAEDDGLREDLRVVEGEVRRMEQSLRGFIDFARPPRSRKGVVSLGSMLERTAALFQGRAAKQAVAVTVEVHDAASALVDARNCSDR